MKKIYLAGKIDADEYTINRFAEDLEARGHRIAYKWWQQPSLKKPYLEYPETSGAAALKMEKAVRASDVLILLAQDQLLGAMTEFGIGLGDQSKPREIIVVLSEEKEVRQSVFYALPTVVIAQGLRGIRERSWY